MASWRVRSSYSVSCVWRTLDARFKGLVRLAELIVLRLETGDLDWIDLGAEVRPGEERGSERKEQESGSEDADLQVRDPPLPQLGVSVGDDDDRVVPFRHELSYREWSTWTPNP